MLKVIRRLFGMVKSIYIYIYIYSSRRLGLKFLIKRARNIRVIGTAATLVFGLVLFLAIFPITTHQSQASATPIASDTEIIMSTTQPSANVDIAPISSDGTFETSTNADLASFDVITNNYTGYTLKLLGNDTTGDLINASYGDALTSITSAINESTFETSSSYTNKWGLKPSKLNSVANTNYLPAPIETGDSSTSREILMDNTSVANTTPNTYTIALGARVDYTKPTGTYTNTYTIVAVGNPASFTISYSVGDVTDTVTDMPSGPTTGSTDTPTITLDSATPQRTGYSFAGWCLGTLSGSTQNPGTTCTGTLITNKTFDINQTTSNVNTLYATWTANNYTCTKQYRLQGADGNYPSAYTNDGTEQVAYNNTCSYSKTVTDYNSNAAKSTSCTITTSGCTASLDFPRNTYALTVNRNTTYLSAASGGGTYRWGQSVSISATTSSSNFTGWSVSSGSSGTFASASSASTTYTMPKGASTIYANGDRPAMNSFNKSTCSSRASSSNIWLYDARDNQYYTARYINGNCWMTRNIAIGCNGSGASYGSGRTSRSLTSSNSNVSTTWSTGSAGALTSGDSFTEARMQCNTTYGAWYNFAAASAGTITGDSNTTDATKDICPASWRLPKNT